MKAKFTWFTENTDDEGNIIFSGTNIKFKSRTDEKIGSYSCDVYIFDKIPDFEYYDKGIIELFNDENKCVFKCEVEANEENINILDIYDPTINELNLSLEDCVIDNTNTTTKFYFVE
jgi:hypothetical protein